jgi:hypothetical protein
MHTTVLLYRSASKLSDRAGVDGQDATRICSFLPFALPKLHCALAQSVSDLHISAADVTK